MSLKKMFSKNTNLLFSLALIIVTISKIQSIYICQEDYVQTSYNLFCPSSNSIALVFRTSASFLSAGAKRTDCVAQPSLILNASNTITTNLCNYCFSRQPCVLTNTIIDSNSMFSSDTYRVSSTYITTPVSIGVFYQCVDKSKVGSMTASQICSDPGSFLGIGTTTAAPTTTPSTTTIPTTTTYRTTGTTSCKCVCT